MLRSLAATHSSVRTQTLWIAAFAVLTAIGARVQIPHLPVPYTMQTFFVLMAGAALGMRNGALSMIAYLALGACGLPVFASVADGTFGITSFIGPTGGYLLAFPVAAALTGFAAEKFSSRIILFVAMTLSTIIIFLIGTIQLNIVVFHDWSAAFTQGFMIFSWWDAAKIFGAFGASQILFLKRGPSREQFQQDHFYVD